MKSRRSLGLLALALIANLLLRAGAESDAANAPASAVAVNSQPGPGARTDTNAPSPGPLPAGEAGALITFGRNIIHDTPRYAGRYIKAGMSCEACHVNAGTKAHAGSLLGIYATFPQYNKRSNHYITLQDRLAECFLYSMNGTPPAYSSREMIAMTAYIAYLSKGAVVGTGFTGQHLTQFKPEHPANINSGSTVYGQRCSACHGVSGEGVAHYPALWGAKSFNDGAGMHRLSTMSAFVRYNMPYGRPPNVLSKQEAYDVSAFVLSHPRPTFDKPASSRFRRSGPTRSNAAAVRRSSSRT